MRDKVAEINLTIAEKLPEMDNVQFFNVDPNLFINPNDGRISHRDMYDYLHFTKRGYQKLLEPLLDEIQMLLKNFIKADSASARGDDES